MSLIHLVTLLLAAGLLASPAHADPFRMSAKAICVEPQALHGKSLSFRKNPHVNTGFIADAFEIADVEAKQFDLVYDPVTSKLSIVKRCDGTVFAQLAHFAGGATSTIGPIGGNQKAARVASLLTDSPWGIFAATGEINCKFFQKVQAGQITALTGLCKGTIHAFGQNCDAQFAPIGKFTPGPGCM